MEGPSQYARRARGYSWLDAALWMRQLIHCKGLWSWQCHFRNVNLDRIPLSLWSALKSTCYPDRRSGLWSVRELEVRAHTLSTLPSFSRGKWRWRLVRKAFASRMEPSPTMVSQPSWPLLAQVFQFPSHSLLGKQWDIVGKSSWVQVFAPIRDPGQAL